MHITRPPIIGLTGYAGTGKDTVRGLLETGFGYIGFAFADPIRAMLRELFTMHAISADYMDSRALKESTIPELGVSYRQLAQTLGTEWGRRCLADDIWVKLANQHMHALSLQHGATPGLRFVVSDVRFVNEAQWIKDQGGEIWRVERPGIAPVRAHTSESELYHFKADRIVNNHGNLVQLFASVMDAFPETPIEPANA